MNETNIVNYSCFYKKSYDMRKRFLELFTKLGYGHLTTAFSEVEIMLSLWERIIRIDNDKTPIDKFVLSKGHGAGMMFPILEDMGFISKDDTENIIKKGGDINTIKKYVIPGFEYYGGSLGIGIGMAAGMAYGIKQNRSDSMVYCLMGDAECYEGAVWEAILYSAHNRLNNLVVIVDRNYLGCSDFTENMCGLEPFKEKWESCNWMVKEVDGHSYEELIPALDDLRRRKTDRPTCIIADTVKGKGLDYLSNIPLMHGYMPKDEDSIKKSFEQLESFR